MELVRTEGGLVVPESALAQEPKRPVAPPMFLQQGVPIPIVLFGGRREPELIPLKGWIWEVQGVNPWAIQLLLRCPTPKMAKKLGLDKKQPAVNEAGDKEVGVPE